VGSWGTAKRLPERMLNKKNIGRAFGVSLATIYATLIAETIYDICPGMHVWLVWLIFICLFTGLYCAGFWALVDRPAELDRKFPTSNKELRRRKQKLYDWLDSLGRR
jgi:hypothetical protein